MQYRKINRNNKIMSNRTTTTLQCVDKSIDLNTDNTLMLPYCIITIEKLILFPILRNCCDLMPIPRTKTKLYWTIEPLTQSLHYI